MGKLGEYWKDMFGGEFSVTLDDTGRIALPRRLRDLLDKDVVLTRGEEKCLSLYTIEYWKDEMEKKIFDSTNQFSQQDRALRRLYGFSPVEIDRQGRILIPQNLRNYAGLTKECIVLGQREYIEIWAEDRLESFIEASQQQRQAVSDEISAGIKQKKDKDLENDGNSSYSGTAGRNLALSGTEGEV